MVAEQKGDMRQVNIPYNSTGNRGVQRGSVIFGTKSACGLCSSIGDCKTIGDTWTKKKYVLPQRWICEFPETISTNRMNHVILHILNLFQNDKS